jgi:hypothetical protein
MPGSWNDVIHSTHTILRSLKVEIFLSTMPKRSENSEGCKQNYRQRQFGALTNPVLKSQVAQLV